MIGIAGHRVIFLTLLIYIPWIYGVKNPSRYANWLGGVVDWDISKRMFNFFNKALKD